MNNNKLDFKLCSGNQPIHKKKCMEQRSFNSIQFDGIIKKYDQINIDYNVVEHI